MGGLTGLSALSGAQGIFDGAGVGIVDFDAALVAFVAAMDKRQGPGPFAAAPIVQGDWDTAGGDSDTVTFLRGAQISSNFYENFDSDQGFVHLWYTPEHSGDGDEHFLLQWSANGYLKINTSNNLELGVAAGVSTTAAVTLTPGTKIHIVARWDSKNALDGTNYLCLSVNDVHTFGRNSSYTPESPAASIYLGSDTSAQNPANGILEGMVVGRRPLFDGAYGVDVNGGLDEINAAWNAGAGEDLCLSIGSWDSVLCIPTSASTGQLTTGTGESWSHCHSSVVEEHPFLEDGGYFGGPYATIFNGTTTEIDCGSDVGLDDLPLADFTVEGWARRDGVIEAYPILMCKTTWGVTGWIAYFHVSGDMIHIRSEYAATPAAVRASVAVEDGVWFHWAACWDLATLTWTLYLNGVDVSTNVVASVGAYQADAGDNLHIGDRAVSFNNYYGAMGWQRVSTTKRYTADFVPPRQPPGIDGNTVAQWEMTEGTGAAIDNAQGNAARDGTLANGTWEAQWDDELTPVTPISAEFDGAATVINCGSAVALDDLPIGANGFTAEGWFRLDSKGESDAGRLLSKSAAADGWHIRISAGRIAAIIYYNNTNAVAIAPADPRLFGSTFHHWGITYNENTDRLLRLWLDGILVATSAASVGNYLPDAARVFNIGAAADHALTMDGAIGWVRLSDSVRYTDTFVPPSRTNPPGADGNTVEQWNMRDGAGNAAVALVTSPGNDGAITWGGGQWLTVRDMATDAPGERVFNWGYTFGSDAANEGITQTLVGLDAGENYVMRVPLHYGRSRRAQPRVRVRDETNGATIVDFDGPFLTGQHDGGNDVAALVDSTAPYWPAGLVGGTVYNVTDGSSATITAAGDSIVGALAGGVDNDWDNTDVYMIVPPNEDAWRWCEEFCFELPTILRNGAAADCVSISVKALNATNEGVVAVHQVELQ